MKESVRRRGTDDKVSCVAYQILAYLAEHPYAGDGLEGIVEWWLLEQTTKYQTTNVKQALERLVERGLVVEEKTPRLRSRYHVNLNRSDEIRAILREGAFEQDQRR